MELVGEYKGWKVYRCSDGMLEGWKSVGLKNTTQYCRPAKELKCVVTNVTTMTEFAKFVTPKA